MSLVTMSHGGEVRVTQLQDVQLICRPAWPKTTTVNPYIFQPGTYCKACVTCDYVVVDICYKASGPGPDLQVENMASRNIVRGPCSFLQQCHLFHKSLQTLMVTLLFMVCSTALIYIFMAYMPVEDILVYKT